MKKRSLHILTSLILTFSLSNSLYSAADMPLSPNLNATAPAQKAKPFFSPFTGKVTRNKVRVRITADLNSPIIKELSQGDLILVNGEEEEFYSVKPPEDVRGYIFRTFVLDGAIEGNRVNVRLEPNTDSPIVAQLSSGDKVVGKVSTQNGKWYEIKLPETARFYVSKDYVQKVGDASLLTTMQKRQLEVNSRLEKAQLDGKAALQGDFPDISYSLISNQYEAIMRDYPEFEEQKLKAKNLFASFKEDYLKKKLDYLETHSDSIKNTEELRREKSELESKVKDQERRLAELQQKGIYDSFPTTTSTIPLWVPVEQNYFHNWQERNGNQSMATFYKDQMNSSLDLRGIIEPYTKKIKNKPGDYLLMSSSGRPIAFLYSTLVNLQELVGTELNIKVVSRPNNDFAFPAYFVLAVE